MVDGEEAGRIITDRALYYMVNPDREFRFLSGDYYDVDAETFLRMKKTLLRLEKLVAFPCHSSLWVRLKGKEDHVTVAVQNGQMKRYWRWAEEQRPADPEMAECLESGEVVVSPPDPERGLLAVLAPVRDSLGDVVGFVELTAKDPESASASPEWS